jgi:hypothetical protein
MRTLSCFIGRCRSLSATKVLNRYFTHVSTLFETGINTRLLMLEDSVKVNMEVNDQVRSSWI